MRTGRRSTTATTALAVAQLANALGPLILRRLPRPPPRNVQEAADHNALVRGVPSGVLSPGVMTMSVPSCSKRRKRPLS